MIKFLRDITTSTDNQTYDVVRSTIAIIAGMLPFMMVWGLSMQTYAYFHNKPFDLQGSFSAILSFLTGSGAFLVGSGASIMLKGKNGIVPAQIPPSHL